MDGGILGNRNINMNMTQEQAEKILQNLINVGVQRGIFSSVNDVMLAQQAYELIRGPRPIPAPAK